jgi:hypothetical protein|nr:MAG TPA: hypothetical protein [Crassvirales sp.]
MKKWVSEMIKQHAHTAIEINNVTKFIENAKNSDKVGKVTFANLALLLRDLKNTAKTYETILNNEGVHFAPDGSYYEKVAEINEKKNPDNND